MIEQQKLPAGQPIAFIGAVDKLLDFEPNCLGHDCFLSEIKTAAVDETVKTHGGRKLGRVVTVEYGWRLVRVRVSQSPPITLPPRSAHFGPFHKYVRHPLGARRAPSLPLVAEGGWGPRRLVGSREPTECP